MVRRGAAPARLIAAIGMSLLAACAAVLEEAQRGAAPASLSGPVDLIAAWSLTGVRLAQPQAGIGAPLPFITGGFMTFMRPAALAVREADVFVVDSGRGVLLRIDPLTQTASVLPLSNVVLTGAVQLAVRGDRSLLLIDGTRTVRWFTADGQPLPSLTASTPDLGQPVDVAVDDARARVFVADGLYRQVLELAPAGQAWRVAVPRDDSGAGLSALAALAIGARGIYLSDPSCGCIVLMHPSGRVLGRFGAAELIQPTALATDGGGRLFVADHGARQLRIFIDGKPVQSFAYRSLGVTEITDLAIDAGTIYIAAGLEARVLALRIVARVARAP